MKKYLRLTVLGFTICLSLVLCSIAMAQPVAMAPVAPAMAPVAPAPAMAPVATPAPVAAPAAPAPAPEVPVAMAPETSPVAPVAAPVAAPAPNPAPVAAAPVAAPAAGKTDPWWKVLIGGLLQILLLFVLTLAVVLGKILITWIAKKAKVTDTEQIATMQKLYEVAVEFGVNFARQQAHKLGDNPDANGKRLEWAVEKANELIKEYELPAKSAEWVKAKIEAKIGSTERAPSNGVPK